MNNTVSRNTVVIFSTRYIDDKDSYLFAESSYFKNATAKLLELEYFKKMADAKCKDFWQKVYGSSGDERLTYSNICQKILVENNELKCKIIDCLLLSHIERRISKVSSKPTLVDLPKSRPKDFFEIARYYQEKNQQKYSDIIKECITAYKQDAWSEELILVKSNLSDNIALHKLLLTEVCEKIGLRKLNAGNELVYAINALGDGFNHKKDNWIRTLYSLAVEECWGGSKEDRINVILVLHDKDVLDRDFHRDFYVASQEEVNTLYGEEINKEDSEPLRVAFYMHTSNPIVDILTKPIDGERDIVNEVNNAIINNIKCKELLQSISKVYDADSNSIKGMIKELDNKLGELNLLCRKL